MATETRVPYFMELSSLTMVPTIVSVSSALGSFGGSVGFIPDKNPVRLLPGETGVYFVTVHNSRERELRAAFQTVVMAHPQQAVGGDLALEHERLLTVRPGNNRLMVRVSARSNAACGTYLVANMVYV